MKMLNQLVLLDKTPPKDRKRMIKLLLANDASFAKYLNLCYNDNYTPRESIDVKKIKYRPTESPMGMDFGSLESVYSKFFKIIFDSENVLIGDNIAEIRLIQIFEIISDLEVEFLKQIIKGKYIGLSKAEYLKIDNPMEAVV